MDFHKIEKEFISFEL